MKSKKQANKPSQPDKPKAVEIANPQVSVFEKYGVKITIGIIFLIAFVCFKDFLLGQKIYLFKDIGSDSLNASWAWMSHSADYISQYGVPSWSFSMGMGQNILSFSFYDPFDYILYMFGKHNMPYLIVYKELAKILLAGFLFFKYLRLLNFTNYTSTIGAMAFAFCGYMVLGSGWYLFSFEVFNAALLLYTFELLYQKGKWQWFALPIFLIGISRPFNFWMYAIFLGLYIVFRLIQDEKKINSKETVLLLGKLLGVSLLGIGLSAPILLEHLQVIIDSP
ncbi:MAG: YfhO family protein, partial [Bacteroidia bacterium]